MNPQTSEPIMNLWTSGPSDYRTFYLMILRATRQNPPQQLTYLSKSTENRIKNCMIDRCLKLKQIHWYFKIILIVPFQSLVIVADYCRFYWDTKHHKIPTWFSWPSHTPTKSFIFEGGNILLLLRGCWYCLSYVWGRIQIWAYLNLRT